MERRFRIRLDELRDDAEVPPSLLRGALPRLETFLQPFIACLPAPERQANARLYAQGLLADLDGKDIESIAYLHDRERQGLQKFIGQAEWDHQPLLAELVRHVGTELGEADGVLVFDPSAFPKKGTESVGVQRQWCGRLGKIDNCQVGLYLGYVSRREHALVDVRLYLPQEWPPASGGGRRPGYRTRPASARGTSCSGRCWTNGVRCCRTPGSPATTNGAVVRGFARNCGRGTSAICWPCRRTPPCGT
jgi:hypothetical protein